jgi:hypothetical protein
MGDTEGVERGSYKISFERLSRDFEGGFQETFRRLLEELSELLFRKSVQKYTRFGIDTPPAASPSLTCKHAVSCRS